MTTYLDTQRVLKVVCKLLDDGVVHGISHAALCRFEERIERGEFDATTPAVWIDAHQAGVDTAKKALVEKDAEIKLLNDDNDRLYAKDEIKSRSIQSYVSQIANLKDRIAQQDQELKDLRETIKELMAIKVGVTERRSMELTNEQLIMQGILHLILKDDRGYEIDAEWKRALVAELEKRGRA
jgi:hypothetical protein